MAGSQDPWRISGEERSKHDLQFFQLKPVNGFVTGTQARDFFLQSGLPTPVLGQIWTLADINGDGKMDKKEFSIAMHLIKKKLQGYELPKVLPPSLKADPAPVVGSFAQPTVGSIPMSQPMAMGFPMGGVQTSVGVGMPGGHLMQPQASLGTATMTTGSLGLGPLMSNGISGSFTQGGMAPVPLTASVQLATLSGGSGLQSGGSIWAMPPAAKMKHAHNFNLSDRNKKGYLLGVEARAILMQSGLPQPVLAQIWTLSDIDRDGKLTCDEFSIAMHLTELARMGQVLPPALPPELFPAKSAPGSMISNLPSAVVPGPQKDAFSDLLGSVGMPLPVPAGQPAQPVEDEEQVSFEDKRKENFDKGQAELERRRAILREQQQKEEHERLEKERHEAEKRERQRLEVEGRRQAELQKQMEKQKEREREIEEQRRKVLEQREAARRELERQRQMEWEKQRREQLMVEKEREAEQIRMIKSQMTNLRNELETLEAKKAELSLKVSQARKGVTDFTAGIDAMRMTRDRTLADIDAFERQTLVLSGRVSALESEKNGLSNQMQTAQTTPLSDAHRTIANSVELKKASIQKLKKELEKIESDTKVRLREIDGSNAELKNLKDQLTKLERDLPHLQKQQEEKPQLQRKVPEVSQPSRKKEKEFTSAAPAVPPLPSSSATSNGQPNWFDFNSSDAFSSSTGGVTSSAVSWDKTFTSSSDAVTHNNTFAAWGSGGTTTGGTQNKQKYRAMYDFPAGREDELTLVAGTEVWVLSDFTPVPGMEDWYKGEHDGKMGWFPKSYVERLDEPSTDLFGGAFESLVQSSNVQTSGQDIFTSKIIQQPSAISSAPATSSADASVPSDIPAEGLLAKAVYPWKARQDTDLTFDKDDIILVKQQDDMKWFGELNGKSGWFPKAYVKLTGVAPKPEPAVNNIAVNQVRPTETSTVPADSQGEYYSALYAYTSDEPSDLTFNEGDIIYVTTTAGDWWSGTIADQGKSGIFPSSYVKKLETQPLKRGVSFPKDSSFDSLLGDFGSVFSSASAKTSSNSFMDALLGSPVDAHPRSDMYEIDALALSKAGATGLSSAGGKEKIAVATVSSETKPNQSSTTVTFDSFGLLESATSSAASSTVQHTEDILTGFDQMTLDKSSGGILDDKLDLSLNLLSRADASGSNKEGTLDGLGYNAIDSHSQLISGESFLDYDAIDNVPSTPFAKEKSQMDTETETSTTLGFSDGVSNDLDLGFGAFEKPSVSRAMSSDFSLLDDFGLVDQSNFSKPAGGSSTSQGQMLDIMDDFGFGAPSASSANMKSSLKLSMSLPDILALENDAIQGDLLEAHSSTADILKSHDIPTSAERRTSVVQVNFDLKKPKIGSKPAPTPPAPKFHPVTKLLFGRLKKKTPEQKSVKKPEIARVIAPYVATGTGQLSLEVGNLINVRQKSPRGWWEGELQVRGQKKKTGWFPANYVKLLSSTSARSTPEPTAAAALSLSDQGFRSATPLGTSSQEATFSISHPDTVVALYSYVAHNDDELTFQKDDVITVLNRDNSSWWSGQVNGHTGMFPTNYVTPAQQSLPLAIRKTHPQDKDEKSEL